MVVNSSLAGKRRAVMVVMVVMLLQTACMQVAWITPTVTALPVTATPGATVTQTPTATPGAPVIVCTVTTGIPDGVVHVRACGSVFCRVTGYVYEGNAIGLLTQSDRWSLIKVGDLTGYVKSDYLDCQEVTKQ